ncbi:MAG: DUF3160 domain-containing protein [bacterium]
MKSVTVIPIVFLMAQLGYAGSLPTVAEITDAVSTEFADYQPVPVNIEPNASSYTIAADFSNVVNFRGFSFSDEEKQLLLQNGFVVTPSTYREMYDAYNAAKEDNLPIFVTVDALLHTYHELYDYVLRTIESKKFIDDLNNLNQSLLAASQTEYEEAVDSAVKEAARRNVAYFSVATKLLNPDYPLQTGDAGLIAEELSLIEAHAGLGVSPIFGYTEDYSQYIPRGHYTLTEELQRYFRCMMWYGRMIFHAEENLLLDISQEMAEKATRRALLIAQLMDRLTVDTEPALDVWERIYRPTSFFVGKSEDLDIQQYLSLARGIYGENFSAVALDDFADNTKLSAFMTELEALPSPRIAPESGKGFRFMGQRFIPDSYMFTELVFPRTGRNFPRGLDVMAVLGSQRAYEILANLYNETADSVYVDQMVKLKTEFSGLNSEEWAQNLYYNWLYCLMPLLCPKGEGFPFFMQSDAWVDKELSCALGSWAELRHDTILYAKQSQTVGMAPSFAYQREYVEPNPWAFARLASLTQLTIDGLDNLGLLMNEFSGRLHDLYSLLLSLKEIAEKELTNRPLTIAEQRQIRLIGSTMAQLTIFDTEHGIGDWLDEDMAVIADVHTDFAVTNECLEIGVGHPLNIYVIIGSGDQLAVAMGSVFSYYEFAWPIGDRLTDEAWIELLSNNPPPSLPEWMGSFVDLSDNFYVAHRQNAMNHGSYVWGSMTLSCQPSAPRQGDEVKLRVTSTNNSSSDLYLETICGNNRTLVPLVADPDTPAPDDFIATIDTEGWSEGTVNITVYSAGSLSFFFTDSFTLDVSAPANEQWRLY